MPDSISDFLRFPTTVRRAGALWAGVFAIGASLMIAPPARANDTGFIETFDDIGYQDRWFVSNYDAGGGFDVAWRRRLAEVRLPSVPTPGTGVLTLSLEPSSDDTKKRFFGAELQHHGKKHFGSYEVYMKAARGEGLVTAFFTYTGPHFDDPHDEIDFEVLGYDTTKIWLNRFVDGEKMGDNLHDLGFDSAEAAHLYRFDWAPNSITWYVDGKELYKITDATHDIPQTPGKLILQLWAGTPGLKGWLGLAGDDARAQAEYYCVSYRPFGDAGKTCTDFASETQTQ